MSTAVAHAGSEKFLVSAGDIMSAAAVRVNGAVGRVAGGVGKRGLVPEAIQEQRCCGVGRDPAIGFQG